MKFAAYDHTAQQPTPVEGWYDTDVLDYPDLPNAADRLEVAAADWPHRFDTPYVQDGQLVAAPEPSVAEQLAGAKAAKLAELQDGYDETIAGGAASDALGKPHIYPVDSESRQDLQASVLAAILHREDADWTAEFACAPADGDVDMDDLSDTEHTANQMIQVGEDVKAWYTAQRKHLKTLTKQVRAADSNNDDPVKAVQKIIWNEAAL